MDIDDNLLTVFYFLVKYSEGVTKDRILHKFSEKRFGKLERLFEMRNEYFTENEHSLVVEVSAEEYLKMIKEDSLGLIEMIDKIIVSLFISNSQIKGKIEVLLPLYKIEIKSIEVVIQRNYKFIDEGLEKGYIEKLLN